MTLILCRVMVVRGDILLGEMGQCDSENVDYSGVQMSNYWHMATMRDKLPQKTCICGLGG